MQPFYRLRMRNYGFLRRTLCCRHGDGIYPTEGIICSGEDKGVAARALDCPPTVKQKLGVTAIDRRTF